MTKMTCFLFAASLAQEASFDITQYGAVGNGTTLASAAINKATGFARATENVTITNCQVSGYDNGTFLDGTYQRKTFDKPNSAGPTGRIKFGTESNGGFKNITISNSAFDYCRGLALESVDGGPIEDITISNVTMRDIVKSPIFLRDIRRVNIAKFVVYNADRRYSSIISGIPGHDIEDVNLSNIRIIYKGGGTKEQAAVKPQRTKRCTRSRVCSA
jgi:polygalacturonase